MKSLDSAEGVSREELYGDFDRNLGPGAIYAAAKRIDGGIPGEATYDIFAMRAIKFYSALASPRTFYERLKTYDTISTALHLNAVLLDGGVSPSRINHVKVALRLFRSVFDAPKGRLAMPIPGEDEVGVHSVALVGFEDQGDTCIFQNSWGASWGDEGYGYMSRSYAEAYLEDAWLTRTGLVGPSIHRGPPIDEKYATALASSWLSPAEVSPGEAKLGDSPLVMRWSQTISLEHDCPVDIVEIRDPLGRRPAWMHLFHMGGRMRDTSSIQELFVWPSFRRRGFASTLENWAVQRSREMGSNKLELVRQEADAQGGDPIGAIAFAHGVGYSWEELHRPWPGVYAKGEKVIE
jgi:GNAT superfamily N-acetyltransferase